MSSMGRIQSIRVIMNRLSKLVKRRDPWKKNLNCIRKRDFEYEKIVKRSRAGSIQIYGTRIEIDRSD